MLGFSFGKTHFTFHNKNNLSKYLQWHLKYCRNVECSRNFKYRKKLDCWTNLGLVLTNGLSRAEKINWISFWTLKEIKTQKEVTAKKKEKDINGAYFKLKKKEKHRKKSDLKPHKSNKIFLWTMRIRTPESFLNEKSNFWTQNRFHNITKMSHLDH